MAQADNTAVRVSEARPGSTFRVSRGYLNQWKPRRCAVATLQPTMPPRTWVPPRAAGLSGIILSGLLITLLVRHLTVKRRNRKMTNKTRKSTREREVDLRRPG